MQCRSRARHCLTPVPYPWFVRCAHREGVPQHVIAPLIFTLLGEEVRKAEELRERGGLTRSRSIDFFLLGEKSTQ